MSDFPFKILLATDGSTDDSQATEVAASIACRTRSELHLLYVEPAADTLELDEDHPAVSYPDGEAEPAVSYPDGEAERAEPLANVIRRVEGLGVTVASACLESGHPDEVVARVGERIGVGLVVRGAQGGRAERPSPRPRDAWRPQR